MKKTFYSNGKLLITAEYLVLNAGISLALPTKFGQNLVVENIKNNKIISWKSYDSDNSLWFEANIPFDSIIRNERFGEAENVKNTLIEILHHAYLIDSNFITNADGYLVETRLTFPRNWGLGTSSTLINNIAQWTDIDAFALLKNSFGGSGYDIACAKNNTAILYQLIDEKPVVKPIVFNPIFKENIYFVYLNQKQNSRNAIINYLNKQADLSKHLQEINEITHQIVATNDIEIFAELLEKHEVILSNILEQQTIKESLFSDFEGIIKSLGAWGGDFVMVVCKENPTAYFLEKGFETILKYDEMIF